MPELDLADAEPAVEGGADLFLRNDCLSLHHAGASLVERHLVLVDRFLRGVLPLAQRRRALQRDRRHPSLRLEIGEVAALGRVVELH